MSKGPFEGRQRLTLGNSGRKIAEIRVKGVGAVSVDRDALRGWGPQELRAEVICVSLLSGLWQRLHVSSAFHGEWSSTRKG